MLKTFLLLAATVLCASNAPAARLRSDVGIGPLAVCVFRPDDDKRNVTAPLCPINTDAGARVQAQLQRIEHGFVQAAVGPERLHLHTPKQWRTFWRRFERGRNPPQIDFRRHDLLIALMGVQSTSGFSVHIGPVENAGDGPQVRVLMCRSVADEPQLAVMTAPVASRLIDKLTKPLRWIVVEGTSGVGVCRYAN